MSIDLKFGGCLNALLQSRVFSHGIPTGLDCTQQFIEGKLLLIVYPQYYFKMSEHYVISLRHLSLVLRIPFVFAIVSLLIGKTSN